MLPYQAACVTVEAAPYTALQQRKPQLKSSTKMHTSKLDPIIQSAAKSRSVKVNVRVVYNSLYITAVLLSSVARKPVSLPSFAGRGSFFC